MNMINICFHGIFPENREILYTQFGKTMPRKVFSSNQFKVSSSVKS